MDVNKLTPAPWTVDEDGAIEAGGGSVAQVQHHGNVNTIARTGEVFNSADAEFISLARNAFDVMMRRGWCPEKAENGRWVVVSAMPKYGVFEVFQSWAQIAHQPDPFTALVEADRWYRDHVEALSDRSIHEH